MSKDFEDEIIKLALLAPKSYLKVYYNLKVMLYALNKKIFNFENYKQIK